MSIHCFPIAHIDMIDGRIRDLEAEAAIVQRTIDTLRCIRSEFPDLSYEFSEELGYSVYRSESALSLEPTFRIFRKRHYAAESHMMVPCVLRNHLLIFSRTLVHIGTIYDADPKSIELNPYWRQRLLALKLGSQIDDVYRYVCRFHSFSLSPTYDDENDEYQEIDYFEED